jgi:hypothetical protein
MRWKTTKKYTDEQFKRLVGVKRSTIEQMVHSAKKIAANDRKTVSGKKRGPKEKYSWYDKVLMLLMYYREYRTFAHIAADYGISEAQCWRIITTLERWLIKSELFHLPGKKRLTQSDVAWEVVLVDVSEHPIERPKKNSANITPAKRKSIH